METKKYLLMAAMLLTSVCMFAQSNNEPLKGDVNEDGKVDVADIVAVVEIIQNGGGTSDETTYYWYIGQTDPNTISSISPIVNNMTDPGWRLIGTSLPTYSASNKLFDGDNNTIVTGSSLAKQYVILPNECNAVIRDGFGNDATTVDIYTKWNNTITLNNVEYKVYESVGKSKKLLLNIY